MPGPSLNKVAELNLGDLNPKPLTQGTSQTVLFPELNRSQAQYPTVKQRLPTLIIHAGTTHFLY